MNKITQLEYEQIKILNEKSCNIIQEFIISTEQFLLDICKEDGLIFNIGKVYNLKKIIEFKVKEQTEIIKIIIDLGEKEIINEKGQKNIIRYYYSDIYEDIRKPVTIKKDILKKYTRKMVKLVMNYKMKLEFQKIRNKTTAKLKKLEEVQNNLNINIPQR